MLKLIRKIFGCYSDPEIIYPTIEEESHECVVEETSETSDEPICVKGNPGTDLIENLKPLDKTFYDSEIAMANSSNVRKPTQWNSPNKVALDEKLNIDSTYSPAYDETEQERRAFLYNIVKETIKSKEKSFISWSEQAMTDVTNAKYAYIKYRSF